MDYAKYVDNFFKTLNATELKSLEINKKIDEEKIKYYKKTNNGFVLIQAYQSKDYNLQNLNFFKFNITKEGKSLISKYRSDENHFQNLENISEIKEEFKNKLIEKGVKIDTTSQYYYSGSSYLKSSSFSKTILKEVLEELEFGNLITVDILDRKTVIYF